MTHDESSGQRMIPWADSFYIFLRHPFLSPLLNFSVRGTNLSVAHGRGVDGGGSSTVRIRPFLRNLNVRLRPRTGVA